MKLKSEYLFPAAFCNAGIELTAPSVQDRKRRSEQFDRRTRDGGKTGETIFNLSDELGVCGVIGSRCYELDVHDIARRDSWDGCAGCFFVACQSSGAHEIQIDDVAPQQGVIAVL